MILLKRIAIAILVYVAIVITFESLIGFFQPANQSTLVITTTDDQGTPHDRVLARLESGGRLYVAANHWPRAWYRRAIAHPEVEVTIDGKTGSYRVVPVQGEERDRVEADHGLGFFFRLLTGFPPRVLLRLDPLPRR